MSRLFLIGALCSIVLASSVQAAEDPLANILPDTSDNRLWKRLMSSLNLVADDDTTHLTWFAPTDRAVEKFLYEMGLTFDELLARPVLVDSILSYHLVPGVSIEDFFIKNEFDNNRDLISSDPEKPSVIVTGDPNDVIEAYRSPATGLVTLMDVQGNRAVVVGDQVQKGNVVFYDISSVLLSSSYFFNALDAIRFYPQWSAAADLFSKAALYSDGIAESVKGATESTFLLPNNDALGNGVARALVSAPAGDLAQIIEYHVVPGLKTVPGGWKNDARVQTLLSGHDITSRLGKRSVTDPYTGNQVESPELTLVSDSGKKARVVVFNIFAGKSVINSLDAPLLPKIAAVAKLTGSRDGGRKLLQRHRSGRNRSGSNWAAVNTQSAIRAAARSGSAQRTNRLDWTPPYFRN